MNYSSSFDSMATKPFTPLWIKYRPAILQLMIAAAEAPQTYKLFSHEFKALSPKDKVSFTFTLKAHQGKAQNDIKKSLVAQDLLNILGGSKKAKELMDLSIYEFSLDKHFVLHISKLEKELEKEKE